MERIGWRDFSRLPLHSLLLWASSLAVRHWEIPPNQAWMYIKPASESIRCLMTLSLLCTHRSNGAMGRQRRPGKMTSRVDRMER